MSVNEKQEITTQATDSAWDRLNELSASTKNVQSTIQIQMQMQAVQIQAHEGRSANTRIMLQDLREDQMRFRDKISKHTSVRGRGHFGAAGEAAPS